ncbi:prolipoprotein diacylglyceryl transferase [Candidatus Woesearchaeota archaeon]|nr:prolipoprotein diacylglyceryl transferase [Candidatus Woesearchaeota archaeon]
MLVHALNPIILKLGFIEIRWYGLFYVIGFLFAIWWTRKFSDFKKDDVYDLFFWLIIGLIAGARLFEVIVWEPAYYFANPFEIIAIWHGGMSFHGGLIGVVAAALIFCRKRKLSFYKFADLIVVPASLAMALVRIGNFINGELYGTITNVPWCFKFPSAEGCRHPSQLYESFYNILNFFILFAVTKYKQKKKYKDGFVFWTFIFTYGVLRFITEFWRYSDTAYLGLNLGQWLCLIMIPIGAVMMIKFRKK